MIWQWFELAEALDGERVGGIVHLFGQRMWCIWKPMVLYDGYRVEGLRAIDEARVIIALAIAFPHIRQTYPQLDSIVAAQTRRRGVYA